MKVAGIVAEYNPFHNGHAHQVERTRAPEGGEASHVVAVMSGSFVQRGEPALLPKADRVRAALAGGVDLVLELPLPWALSSAEGFAYGAVSVLAGLGCVDLLSFGSECGEVAPLEKAVSVMEGPRFSSLLRYHLDYGISFPEARRKAVEELAGSRTASLLDSPNNILGIEYLKALRRLSSPIQPFTLRRLGPEHDAERPLGDMASASYLRSLYRAGRVLDAAAYLPRAVCPVSGPVPAASVVPGGVVPPPRRVGGHRKPAGRRCASGGKPSGAVWVGEDQTISPDTGPAAGVVRLFGHSIGMGKTAAPLYPGPGGQYPGMGNSVRRPQGEGRCGRGDLSPAGVPGVPFCLFAGGSTGAVCIGVPGGGSVRLGTSPPAALWDGVHRGNGQGVTQRTPVSCS